MKNEPIINVPAKRVEIHSRSELYKMDYKVTELVICSKSVNNVKMLNLNKYEWLQSIDIGDDCFRSVKSFKIDGQNRLKSLKIGKNSFNALEKEFLSTGHSDTE